MWGHYCHTARGIVIGFDKASPIFQHGKGLRRVDYVKQRVWFDACWEIGSPEMASFDDQITFSKSCHWHYEEEFRQIFTLPSSLLVKRPLFDSEQTCGYFLPFPPEAIVSVTLGPNWWRLSWRVSALSAKGLLKSTALLMRPKRCSVHSRVIILGSISV
jgi:hypothetical protein